MFPKADKIFNDQKIELDDDSQPKHKITEPNTQTLFNKLNNEKLPKELKFFSEGSDYSNEDKFHALQNIGILNESKNHFLENLLLGFVKEVLAKNKMKIHLDTANIYYDNLSMRWSIYSFMHAQEDENKKPIDFECDISDNFEF